jgi:tetratricopeptide (TPR) repeat protein
MQGVTSELFRRRVPQFVGLYLAGSWAFVEFLDWAVEQFVLSPHVTSFAFLLLLLLLPSVAALAWRHGAPGRDGWGRIEAIGIPLNLILATALLYFGFSGKDLGAATTKVVVEDEAGNEIERQVPKEEFRKKLAVFYFDNETGDGELDWLSYGTTLALEMDLAQQLFVITASPFGSEGSGGILQELEEAGFQNGVNVPLTLKREIAEKRHLDYFVAGSFRSDTAGTMLQTELYETRRGRLLAEHTFSGDDVLSLVDELSDQLRRDLGVPGYRIEESADLPVSELLTSSETALADAAVALHSATGGDIAGGVPRLESAVEADPTFALAQAQLGIFQLLSNQRPEAEAAMEAAMLHLYRLPERAQFGVRTIYYWLFRQDPDKAFQTAKYWVEVYPDDIEGHLALVQMYMNRGDTDRTIAELEVVLDLDPTQYDLIRQIGALHAASGDFEQALEHYSRYAELLPGDFRSYTAIASVHRSLGQHEQARAAYDRAQIVEPEEASVPLAVASHEMDLGDLERATRYRDRALAASKSPQDRYAVFSLDETLHYRQGKFREIEQDYARRRSEAEQYMDPTNMGTQLAGSELLVYAPEAGRERSALRELDALSAGLTPPFDGLLAPVYLRVYLALEDTDRARIEMDRIEAVVQALGFEALRNAVTLGSGRIAEIEGDCGAAIASYESALETDPDSRRAVLGLARCKLALGDPADAEERLNEVLRVAPAYPPALYELARVYEETGRIDEALERLRTLLEIWKDADPEYIPAQEARAKLAELEARG